MAEKRSDEEREAIPDWLESKSQDKFYEKEERLANYEGEDRVVPSHEIEKELSEISTELFKVKSNLPTLDDLIEGFQGGELIIVSGPTKQGKTTFCQSLTKNFEDQGVKSLWFSFEVPLRQLFKQFIKADTIYLPRRLHDKRLDWLEDRILEAKIKYDAKVIFIDHLHYLVDIEKTRNASIEIGSIIRKLKSICVEHEVIIFLMVHTTKTRIDDMPTEENVRDSSFIPQEADSTLMIWREKKLNRKTKEIELTGKTVLLVSNHRRTGVMQQSVPLVFKDGMLYELSYR